RTPPSNLVWAEPPPIEPCPRPEAWRHEPRPEPAAVPRHSADAVTAVTQPVAAVTQPVSAVVAAVTAVAHAVVRGERRGGGQRRGPVGRGALEPGRADPLRSEHEGRRHCARVCQPSLVRGFRRDGPTLWFVPVRIRVDARMAE